jgi:glycosyltransferase involved in cell wall biosynthesis
MKKCHFVYAYPLSVGFPAKIFRRLIYLLQGAGLPFSLVGLRDRINTDKWPIGSPYANSKFIYQGLKKRIETKFYHLHERGTISFSTEDIIIAHPLFPYAKGEKGITNRTVKKKAKPKIFALISPLHCHTELETSHINKSYLDSIDRLLPRVDLLFAIMGEYWWKQWDNSPYAHWKKKMVRLDMGIETKFFPRVKDKFNRPGERGFLYIGRNDPMKGISFLRQLAGELRQFRWGWIGSGNEIPNIPRVSQVRSLSPEFMRGIANQFDFFITTGIADPNPTTILESMSWGFPVICTPQSGYFETDYLSNIFLDDLQKSIRVLNDFQYMAEESLLRRSVRAESAAKDFYTWERCVETIWSACENKIKEKLNEGSD